MIGNQLFEPVSGQGWRRGFGPLFRKESATWWGTRRWLLQAALWTFLLNTIVAFILFVAPRMTTPEGQPVVPGDPLLEGARAFLGLGSLAIPIGIIVLTQGLLLDERVTGIAEWLLSKPISRVAFILAKLVANSIAIFLLLVLLPALVAYGLLWVAGGTAYPLQPFIASTSVLALLAFFYLTLTLFMGVVSESRGVVLGVTLGSLLGGSVVASVLGRVALVTPWPVPQLLAPLVEGQALPTELLLPVIATALWSVMLIGLAVWRFERLEL